jgi:hypothetical protein
VPKYFAALIGVALAIALPAHAAPPPDSPSNMSSAQFQSVSCLGTGALGALVAYAYTDLLVVTGTVIVNPVLVFAPVVATGFAFGCSIGSNAAAGVYWLDRKLQ